MVSDWPYRLARRVVSRAPRRPKTLTLAAAPEVETGSVLRATFHGHSVDYEVETGSGTLTVTVPGPHPQGLLAEGTNVSVVIDPAQAYVLVKS
ncbi:iron(III) transport system ATP-binding protein [Nonomuraea jiangxiensis]|uniref:Iron(III) transport system ATP-binding protein n=1 Tax=Nonomuraea jiangxiensis TaxID=633440 RepID=A0A1G8PYK8_9ACTN|nr:iron(III) transport system ATP-binding protein [Nonomuraea jiangxiensis]